MFKRLAWIVLIAATAAAGGCLTGSGAVRGGTSTPTSSPSASR
jgi:hypothetical protein